MLKLQRRAESQELGESLETALGNIVDVLFAGDDIGEVRVIKPLQDEVVTGLGVVGVKYAGLHEKAGADGDRDHRCGADGRAQSRERAIHEEDDQAIGQ